ncbi:MAG: protease modulator HflC [Planctomycetota bacterium]|nr:MAG: protease modulator HflC [Planctomycetota bacterium]
MSTIPINHPLLQAARQFTSWVLSPLGVLGLLAVIGFFLGGAYIVDQTEQAVITQFGRPVGGAINADTKGSGAGLHFKLPLIQTVNRFERRIIEWDGAPSEMTTRDKLFVVVDTFARWRISDPLLYFQSLRDERSAISRLDDILGSETRNVIARHDLIEVVRSDKDRVAEKDDTLVVTGDSTATLAPIQFGRQALEREILAAAAPKVTGWGIELLDVRVKRLNYKSGVIEKIYERMSSERMQIAERFRSQGAGEAAKIEGKKEKDLRKIESEAYLKVQEIMGEADAKAAEIYASAYASSPKAAEFYRFAKTLETYRETLGHDATLILTTDSDFFRLLKSIAPAAASPSPPGTPAPPAG